MDWYVYLWFYPTGVPLYVGLGRWRTAKKRQRYEDHLVWSRNRQLAAAFRRYGPNLPIVIVRDGLTSIEAKALEVALISAIGRTDLKTGPLANRTDGGDGLINPTDDIRERIGAANRGRKHEPPSEETRKRIGEANRRPKPDGYGAKISAILSGIVRSPEFKTKISATMTGRSLSAEHRANLSRVLKGRGKGEKRGPMKDETRAKLSASHKRSMTLERRALLSRKAKAAWANPEIRERQTSAIREAATRAKQHLIYCAAEDMTIEEGK